MSSKSPQIRALLLGAGSSVALAAGAFVALPVWAAVLVTLAAFGFYVVVHLITLIPFAALTMFGLSTRCPERRETSKEFFQLFLRLLGR